MIPRWVWVGGILGAAAWFLLGRRAQPAGHASTLGAMRPIQPPGGGDCGL